MPTSCDEQIPYLITPVVASCAGKRCVFVCVESSHVTFSSPSEPAVDPSQYHTHRICCSLFLQIISRFFVTDALLHGHEVRSLTFFSICRTACIQPHTIAWRRRSHLMPLVLQLLG